MYHYRLVSTDAEGDITKSADRTFTTKPLAFVAGQRYPIRMEVVGGGTVALSWSAPGMAKQVIPQSQLLPTINEKPIAGIDLMAGLPYSAVLPNGQYGWTRTPAAETLVNATSDYWSVRTNVKTAGYRNTPDIWTEFRQPSATNIVARDLGVNTGLATWELSGAVNLRSNYENTANDQGMFVDVVDDQGKIIVRFYVRRIVAQTDIVIYANGVQIARGTLASLQEVMNKSQPFKVAVANGKITVTYGPYAPVVVPTFDPAAKMQNPKTFRLYFTHPGTTTANRRIGINDFFFHKN